MYYVHSRSLYYLRAEIEVDVLSFSASSKNIIDGIRVITEEQYARNNDRYVVESLQEDDCYLLDEELALYRRGRKGSDSTNIIKTILGWHYRLYRKAGRQNPLMVKVSTGRNLVFGFYKKMKYLRCD